jgi:hypothetical protein
MTSLPRLDAYIATLPNGLASYPSCRGKASLFRFSNELAPVVDIPGSLPSTLLPYMHCTLPPNQWVSELDYVLFTIALCDIHGWDNDGLRVIWQRVMEKILNSAMYGPVFKFLSAKMLVKAVASRWSSFHLGTDCSTANEGDDVIITLSWPRGLFPELIVHGYIGVFEGLAQHSRFFKGGATLLDFDDTRARYRLRSGGRSGPAPQQ